MQVSSERQIRSWRACRATFKVESTAPAGHAVQSFVTEFYRFGFLLAGSPKASREIRTIKDLKGARIGVTSPGAQLQLLVNYLLSRSGLTAVDYTTVAVGPGASNLAY